MSSRTRFKPVSPGKESIVFDTQNNTRSARDTESGPQDVYEVTPVPIPSGGGEGDVLSTTINLAQDSIILGGFAGAFYSPINDTMKLRLYIDGVQQSESGTIEGAKFRAWESQSNKACSSGARIIKVTGKNTSGDNNDVTHMAAVYGGACKL